MEERTSEPESIPIQLSLRIRHPSIDPEKISSALGHTPEHSFKAGSSRSPGSGRHTQTYWLASASLEEGADPLEPSFLETIASKSAGHAISLSPEELRKATRDSRIRSPEILLMSILRRLNTHHSFLQQLQRDGGDVALIMLIESESGVDFTLSPAVSRLLAQLDVSVEFKLA